MNYFSELPIEIKLEIFNKSTYVSKISIYQYIITYDEVADRYLELIKSQLNKVIFIRDIKEIFKTDNVKLYKLILEMSPTVSYIDRYLRLKDYQILKLAVSYGSIGILEFLFNKHIDISEDDQAAICYKAIRKNHIDCLNYIRSKDFKWRSDIFLAAAKSNNFELFKYFHNNNLNINEDLNQEKNIFLLNNPYSLTDKNMTNTCHIWKHIDRMYHSVAKHGNIEFLDYLYNIKPITNGKYLSSSIKKNNNKIIEWGIKKLIPMTEKHCRVAASTGNLELLKWLREIGCPWDGRTAISACKSGNIKLFEYVTQKLDDTIICFNTIYIYQAAKRNHLEMVKYLNDRGFPGNISVLYFSSKHNNFEMFKYGVDRGYYIYELKKEDAELMENTLVKKNRIVYLKYLIINRYQFIKPLSNTCCQFGKFNLIKTLNLQCNFDNISIASMNEHYFIIVKLVENGMPLESIIISNIIINDNINMFRWCLNHGYLITRSDLITTLAFDRLEFFKLMAHLFQYRDEISLISKKSLNILKYLHQNQMLSFDLNLYSLTNDIKVIGWLKSINYPQLNSPPVGPLMRIISEGIELYLYSNK